MGKSDKEIVEMTRPLIAEELEVLLTKLIDKKLERVVERVDNVSDKVGELDKNQKEIERKIDSLELVADTIDGRTKQIKKNGDKTPDTVKEIVKETINKNLKNVPEHIENGVARAIDKKPRIYLNTPGFWSRLKRKVNNHA